MVDGRATGKIILMGEHAVVYGEPAIALPFSAVEMVSTVTPHSGELMVSCDVYDGLVHRMPKIWESLKHAIRFSLYRIGAPSNPAIHIQITSTIPVERGMGSSAAVATAVARSLFTYYQKELTSQELWEIVQSSEKIAHGNPSGIDATTIVGQEPIFFVRETPPEKLSIHLEAYLIVADTGEVGHTLEAVQRVSNLVEHHETARLWIEQLGVLTREAKDDLKWNRLEPLGEKMVKAHACLQGLQVSHPLLDRLVEVSLANGALGAKLTGGGCGGCMIALARDLSTARTIAAQLAEAGATQTWIQFLGEINDR